jgi:hypothetical protein
LLLLFCQVNISDAWLLSDSESHVFYRHFRDKVTWAEADSICQFHHSVLATGPHFFFYISSYSLLY